MAYIDTDQSAGSAVKVRPVFYRLVKFLIGYIDRIARGPSKSPESVLAAQYRAEAHRRAVDNLIR